jgi:hypothetical protein
VAEFETGEVKEEEEKKKHKWPRASSQWLQFERDVKKSFSFKKGGTEDPKEAKKHAKKVAKLNKQSSDAIKKAKDRNSGKTAWKNTKAGKEHAKKMKKLTDAAKRKAKLARMRKHLKAVQKQRKDNKPLKKQYTPSKSGLGINNK